MLHKAMKELRHDEVVAADGRVGAVDDVYFDDDRWTVRYLVVDTGEWLPGRRVLIAPAAVERNAMTEDTIPVALTRKQVREAPGVERDQPVSRRLEQAHADYYGYPYYWEGVSLWGAQAVPPGVPPAKAAHQGEAARRLARAERAAHESRLRSGLEIVGYSIAARDGTVGHVKDFLIDDREWSITDVVVDTRDWLPGKFVLISPDAVDSIDWALRLVRVRLTRDEVQRSPRAR